MTALTGLIDALLAARLAPRLDVLGIKPEAAIGAPGPVVDVEKAANDVRLPSHAALDREIPGAATGLAPRAGSGAPASVAMHMSVAARVIGAVLADLQAAPGPVRGALPAVPTPAPGSGPAAALAGGLAQTVAGSGLFYESHLAQFAAGTRTLAQMAQEPQARWSAVPLHLAPTAPAPGAATLPAVDAVVVAAAAAAAAEGEAGVVQALPRIAAEALPGATLPGAPVRGAGTEPSGAGAPTPSVTATPAIEAATHIEAARLQAAYGWAEPAAAAPAAQALPARHAEEAAVRHAAAAAAPAGGEVIHPQAVTLVHQQLDLLATSVFRWNGEAWPGVPMRWSIEEEKSEPESDAATPDDDRPRRWSTRVTLELPRLGAVEMRLGIAGPGVHAHLAAGEAATLALLRADSARLASRFEAAGLRLQELQLGAEASS